VIKTILKSQICLHYTGVQLVQQKAVLLALMKIKAPGDRHKGI